MGGIYIKLKDYVLDDKPREKLINNGVSYLSDCELLQILLRTGNKDESVNELASRIIRESGGIYKLSLMPFNSLLKIKGIKESKASVIVAAFEMCKRISKDSIKKLKLSNSESIYNYFKDEFIGINQEMFYVLLFDIKMNLIKKNILFKGTVDSVEVHPREIFKDAIMESASYIVVMHNHPSGDVTPSSKDIEVTSQLLKVSEIVGIKFIDHIIISSSGYYSFYENAFNDKSI